MFDPHRTLFPLKASYTARRKLILLHDGVTGRFLVLQEKQQAFFDGEPGVDHFRQLTLGLGVWFLQMGGIAFVF